MLTVRFLLYIAQRPRITDANYLTTAGSMWLSLTADINQGCSQRSRNHCG